MSDPPNEPLYGANIKPNLLDNNKKMKYKKEVADLLEMLEKEVKQEENHVRINCLFIICLFVYRSTSIRY